MTASALRCFVLDGRGAGRRLVQLMLSGGAKQYIINVEPRRSGYFIGPQPLAMTRA